MQLPTEEALTVPVERIHPDLRSYREEIVIGLSEAWELAQTQVKKAQRRAKQ